MFGVSSSAPAVATTGAVATPGLTVARSARSVTSWCILTTSVHWTSRTLVHIILYNVYVCTYLFKFHGRDLFYSDDDEYDSGKPHLSHLCEKCKKLGHNCRGGRGGW